MVRRMPVLKTRKEKHKERHAAAKLASLIKEAAPAIKKRKLVTSVTSPTNTPHAVFVKGIKGSDSILEVPFPQIAFVGRSNVGKSSSINAILGVNNLARTSRTPGKTQEINFFLINDNMYFVDLPGYGYAKVPVKTAEQIRKHILWYLAGGEAHPKLVILIIDARHGATDDDRELMSIAANEGHPILVLINKIDKLSGNERTQAISTFVKTYPTTEFIPFSAFSKEGITEVRKRIFG
jgi:GTP-binding protein